MEHEKPWIEVPDDWLDDEYSTHSGYRVFQEYFNLKVKPSVINEHLFGERIKQDDAFKVDSFEVEHQKDGSLSVLAGLKVKGFTKRDWKITREIEEDVIAIARAFDRNKRSCSFDWLSSSKIILPDGFGREYYRKAIPLLRKLKLERLSLKALTTPEKPDSGNVVGAYVWSFYGYSNENMEKTLEEYIEFLKNLKGIILRPELEKAKLNIRRMRRLARSLSGK